jgi:hypothetical protein
MDAGALANILRRPVAATDGAGHERTSLNLRLAIDVVAAQGGRADLVRELQALTGRYSSIRLVQSPGGAARLEAGPLRFAIAAEMREALIAALARAPSMNAGRPAASTTAASSSLMAQAAPTASSAAAVSDVEVAQTGPPPTSLTALAAASVRAAVNWPARLAVQSVPGRPRASMADAPAARLPLPGPALLDDSIDTAAAAARLQSAVRDSGVFAEAQMARAIVREQESPAPVLPRAPAELTLAERATAQLELLRRDAAAFSLAPWNGVSMELDLGREPIDADTRRDGSGDAAQVFTATLKLDLPRRGPVTVSLRLARTTLAATIAAAAPEPWRDALPELAARLQARGLQPAALLACCAAHEDEHAPAA